MTYFLNGVILSGMWFLAVNIVASLCVATWQYAAGKPRSGADESSAAGTLLFLRLGPAALSLITVAGIFVPSYWWLEPRDLDETFGLAPLALVAVSGTLLVAGIRRGVTAYRRVIRSARTWMRAARQVRLPGTNVPVFCVEGLHLGMTLVGVIRARIFISRPLLDALSAAELQAAIAHEIGHHRARDNFKRLAIQCAPDVLSYLPVGRRLDHDWALAAEHAADAEAALTPHAGLVLASALVKAARLTPRLSLAGPTSPLIGGAISARVQRLITIEPAARAGRGHWVAWSLLTVVGGTTCLIGYGPLLNVVHTATEVLAHALP